MMEGRYGWRRKREEGRGGNGKEGRKEGVERVDEERRDKTVWLRWMKTRMIVGEYRWKNEKKVELTREGKEGHKWKATSGITRARGKSRKGTIQGRQQGTLHTSNKVKKHWQ